MGSSGSREKPESNEAFQRHKDRADKLFDEENCQSILAYDFRVLPAYIQSQGWNLHENWKPLLL